MVRFVTGGRKKFDLGTFGLYYAVCTMHHFTVLQEVAMHTTYFDEDDNLVIRLPDKPVTREVSQKWNTHINHAEHGSAVGVMLLEVRANGAYPLEVQHAWAA